MSPARKLREALQQLQAADVSVVLCSSQTRAEVEDAQQALGIACPFICESGCAAFVPSGHFPFAIPNARAVPGYCAVELGRPHSEISELLEDTARRQRIDIRGFRDMPVEEVARACHLPLLQARLAKLRESSERFRILDSWRGHAPASFRGVAAGWFEVLRRRAVPSGWHGREHQRRGDGDHRVVSEGIWRRSQRGSVCGDSAVRWTEPPAAGR